MRRLRVSLLAAAVAASGSLAVTATTPAAAVTCTISTQYREGMSGTGVNCIERRLYELGYQWSYIDKLYGSYTTSAVKRFQTARGLPVTGVVNQATAEQLGIWATGTSTSTSSTSTPSTTPSGTTTYTVKSGDSLYGIASKTGTPINTLLSLNGLTLKSVIHPGQVLIVSGSGSTTSTTNPPTTEPRIKETRTIGYSVKGRPIVAYRLGTEGGTPVLAVGNIHGDESRGTMITNYLLNSATIPSDVELWVIKTVNPDGLYYGTRGNARKVDLNRNFNGGDWRLSGTGTEKYSGPSAASEPETKAVQAFIQDIDPVVAVWWHQIGQHVDDNRMVYAYPLLKRYAAITGYPVKYTSCGTYGCTGNATTYVNNKVRNATSFVVEMPSWYSSATAARHAKAFLTISHEAQ